MAKKNNAIFKSLPIGDLIPNPDNPRYITEENFQRLIKSVQSLPKMLEVRPVVINEDNMIIGGNQRVEAMRHLGYEEVTVIVAKGWTPDEIEQYLIIDNTHFGDWAWSMLDKENKEAYEDMGIRLEEWKDLPQFDPNLTPTSSNGEVTADDLLKQQGKMDGAFSNHNPIEREVVCPHCLETFKMR